jgi:NAD(P)H-hydrate epimerase
MNNLNSQLYYSSEIRKIENLAFAIGMNSKLLMTRAGEAVFHEIKRRWPEAKKITIVCGKGNNAGDGYVVASLAKRAKIAVRILQLTDIDSLIGAAKNAYLDCKKLKIEMLPFSVEGLQDCDLIVDAIFGIGFSGKLSPVFSEAIQAINQSNLPILAVDIPSGINADSGEVLQCAVRADVTVTFIGRKIGLYVGEARNYCGEVALDSLDIPKDLFNAAVPAATIMNLEEELRSLVPRKRTSHKGDFGRVLVIGGDHGMGGAVRLAAEGALRAGAGYVVVATRAEHVNQINVARPEIMVHGITSSSQLLPLLQAATVIVIGPGLGLKTWGRSLFKLAIAARKPMAIDGDGLGLLANYGGHGDNWILTPHPLEAARLLSTTVVDVQANRLEALQNMVKKYGGVCVLKGSGSLVGTAGQRGLLCDAGNPGMASAGMGDLLGGIIAGLLAQKLNPFRAARLGIMIHATAGDLVAEQYGTIGIAALDLVCFIRKIMNCIIV